jgi:hypothetical protein
MIEISLVTTTDSPDGQPWPPSDGNALWVVVRRADSRTLWRAIQFLKSDPLPRAFANLYEAATEPREVSMRRDEGFPSRSFPNQK